MLEQYQQDRIDIIKKILPLLGDNFVLKGGTALSLYYGLNRYSEDIDLDAKSNNMNVAKILAAHKGFKDYHISIKKDTDTVFRAMIDYGASSHLGDYPLKIEVSNRNKPFLQSGALTYQTINRVNVYNINELIDMKISAFNGRDKVRDLYDLNFLLENYPSQFSDKQLWQINERIAYCGTDELNLLLQDEAKKHKLVSQDDLNLENFTQLLEVKILDIQENKQKIKNFKHNAKKFNAYETEYNTINKDFSEGKIDENTKKQAFESLENKFSIKVAEFELLLTERSNARKVEAAKVKFQTNPQNEISQDKELDR